MDRMTPLTPWIVTNAGAIRIDVPGPAQKLLRVGACPQEGFDIVPGVDIDDDLEVNIHDGEMFRVRTPGGGVVHQWREGLRALVRYPYVLEVRRAVWEQGGDECGVCGLIYPRGERAAAAGCDTGIADKLVLSTDCPNGHGPLSGRPRCLQCGRAPVWVRP